MNPSQTLDRLRDPDAPHLSQLAALGVTELLERPLHTIAEPEWLAQQLAAGIDAATGDPTFATAVKSRLEQGRARFRNEERGLRHWLPPEAEKPLRKLLSRPWTPDEELTFQVLNHDAIRGLIREVLRDTLTRFANRARAMDQGVLKGMGGRAVRRGRGLLGSVAGAADSLVGAMKSELEQGIERTIRDFLSGAVGDAVRIMARHLSDPAHAESFSALRVGTLDVLLDTPVQQLAAEADKLEPEELVDVVLGALRSTSEQEGFAERIAAGLDKAMEVAGHVTLGKWLEEAGMTDAWTTATTELLTRQLRAVVATDAFAAWWDDLHA